MHNGSSKTRLQVIVKECTLQDTCTGLQEQHIVIEPDDLAEAVAAHTGARHSLEQDTQTALAQKFPATIDTIQYPQE
jgi:hypothetical protein